LGKPVQKRAELADLPISETLPKILLLTTLPSLIYSTSAVLSTENAKQQVFANICICGLQPDTWCSIFSMGSTFIMENDRTIRSEFLRGTLAIIAVALLLSGLPHADAKLMAGRKAHGGWGGSLAMTGEASFPNQ
jgi:hypothetical protein